MMPEVQELVKSLADKYGRKRENLLHILQGIVEQENYLSDVALTEVARELDMSAAQVYGTATFYTFLDTEPRGKYVVRICRTITCDMKGKNQIIQAVEDTLKIKLGETSQNKKFSLLETNCMGWCHEGPAMLINDQAYTNLTVDKAIEIITDYVKNK
jgi:NADH-quinone oxidoreductase subunit E